MSDPNDQGPAEGFPRELWGSRTQPQDDLIQHSQPQIPMQPPHPTRPPQPQFSSQAQYPSRPPYPTQQPTPPQQPTLRQRLPGRNIAIGCGALLVVCLACAGIEAALQGTSGTSTFSNASATSTPTSVKATQTPRVVHYPPTTQADLFGLRAMGDASAIHEFHCDSVGLVGVCPVPERYVTVASSITGQQLAEDLLAYFYDQQLTDPCGSVVFAYHSQKEASDFYTAGRILFDVIDSSGQANIDPNATNLKYKLTLDVGGALVGQEYVVTY